MFSIKLSCSKVLEPRIFSDSMQSWLSGIGSFARFVQRTKVKTAERITRTFIFPSTNFYGTPVGILPVYSALVTDNCDNMNFHHALGSAFIDGIVEASPKFCGRILGKA